jgi:hypothetical protein
MCPDTTYKWPRKIHEVLQPLGEQYLTLTSIIKWALLHCRDRNAPFLYTLPHITHDDIHPLYFNLIQAQSDIGWNQILKGRWATLWVHHIDLLTPDKGEKVLADLTKNLWYACIAVWKERCNTIHSEDNIQATWKNQLHPQVKAIYQLKDRLDTTDRLVLDKSMDETLIMPRKALQDWIKSIGNFVKIGLKRANLRQKKGTTASQNNLH